MQLISNTLPIYMIIITIRYSNTIQLNFGCYFYGIIVILTYKYSFYEHRKNNFFLNNNNNDFSCDETHFYTIPCLELYKF